MMGVTQGALEVPVVKGTTAMLCFSPAFDPTSKTPVCIRCGKCVGVCPMHLQPLYLFRYGKKENSNKLKQYHLLDCIECGSCNYICPGRVPLVAQFRASKQQLREEANKK